MKAGVVQGLAERAVRVSSSDAECDAELRHISSVMVCNGYPRRFVEKAISKQLRRRTAPRVQNQDQSNMKTVRIPFVEGLSQEVRRVARSAGVRCVFYLVLCKGPASKGVVYSCRLLREVQDLQG